MSSWKNIAKATVRVVLCSALLTLLIGCGGSNSRQSKRVSPTQVTEVSSLTAGQKGFDVQGLLHIESSNASCLFDPKFELFSPGNLVLNDNHPITYDSSEIQQIEKYTQALYGQQGEVPPLPAALRTIQGGLECSSVLTITNTSQTTIQIQSINMRLMATPQLTTTHYHLIDLCLMLPAAEEANCPGLFGGGPSLGFNFQLRKSSEGANFQAQSPSPITLKPSDIAPVALTFTTVGIRNNLIYNVMPELILSTGTIELKPATMELIFADKDQFTCGHFNKDTIVFIPPLPRFLPNGELSGHWCI
jgi:hypothetical protein